jgi:hypothetical protein
MNDFPKDWGFMYDEDTDEWFRKTNMGLLILYRKLTSYFTWSLSFVDEDDYQHFLIESDNESEIISQFKIVIRDSKIDELLSP